MASSPAETRKGVRSVYIPTRPSLLGVQENMADSRDIAMAEVIFRLA